MPLTKLTIINSALAEAGARPVEDVDNPTSTTEKVVAAVYPQVFRTMLGNYNWPFASKWAELELEEDNGHPEYLNSAELPADLLALWHVRFNTFHTRQFEVNGNKIFSHFKKLEVNYTYEADPALFNHTFTQALVFKLAAALATPLATNDSRRAELARDADYWLRFARTEASRTNPNRQLTSPILEAHGGYGPI